MIGTSYAAVAVCESQHPEVSEFVKAVIQQYETVARSCQDLYRAKRAEWLLPLFTKSRKKACSLFQPFLLHIKLITKNFHCREFKPWRLRTCNSIPHVTDHICHFEMQIISHYFPLCVSR